MTKSAKSRSIKYYLDKKNVDRFTESFIRRYLEELNTPRSLAIWLLYDSGSHLELLSLGTEFLDEPVILGRWLSIRDSYLATEFLSKYDCLNTGIQKNQVAVDKFLAAEKQCMETNRRLLEPDKIDNIVVRHRISRCAALINRILGKFDPHRFVSAMNWGPGATVSLTRDLSHRYDKFRLEDGMNQLSYEVFGPLWETAFPRWDVKPVVQQAYLHTVPKNSKTDRCIVIEPGLSTFMQKGLGDMIRTRLSSFGLDIRKGQRKHADLAEISSQTGKLATIDFSSASDTISLELVRALLPEQWFKPMYSLTSRNIQIPLLNIDSVELSKFSSMGNGFTFELETLIFLSIALIACDELNLRTDEVSVYGDDVILPVEAVDLFREISTYCGFSFNSKKSFSSGHFRESCGAHWLNGLSLKPIYLRSKIRNVHDLFKVSNQLRRLPHRLSSYSTYYDRFTRIWLHLTGSSASRKFSVDLRDFYISDGYGDCGLCVNFDEASPTRNFDYQRGFSASVIVPSFRKKKFLDGDRLLLAKLFDNDHRFTEEEVDEYAFQERATDIYSQAVLSDIPTGNGVSDRRSGIRISKKEMFIPVWYNLGDSLHVT